MSRPSWLHASLITLFRWTSVCLSIDLERSEADLYADGTHLGTRTRLVTVGWEAGGGGGGGAMTMILGHAFTDEVPLLGKIVRVNVWDRLLTRQASVDFGVVSVKHRVPICIYYCGISQRF